MKKFFLFALMICSSLMASAALNLRTAAGWQESAYMEFTGLNDTYAFYNAYVSADGGSNWTKLDGMLVRSYGSYGRVDAVGLKAGSNYKLKVVPAAKADSAEIIADAVTSGALTVTNYDRSGFAHTGKYTTTGVGAYNNDGTLKSNAVVLYVSNSTAKTVQMTVNGATTNPCVGLQSIISGYEKGKETRPLAVRFIGEVKELDSYGSKEDGLQIKGRNADSELNMTFEGIGNDAFIHGWGFFVRNAASVEMRNFGVATLMDDDISLDTDNDHIWIHNIDAFYGPNNGGEPNKGDGIIDIKSDSKHVTVAYCHFWDTGKSSMCGMKSETGPNYITYHHNWFDHSDSRHARVRTMSVHMYNNYYDGIAKYGVGATTGSSVFMEANYFRACQRPMLISMQGTDTKMGTDLSDAPTFSREDGGIIKSYANKYATTVTCVTYQTNSTHFDCWEATARDAKVPSDVKTLQGGHTYNNFDTDATVMYTYTPDKADDVPDRVTGQCGAGRIQHGDLQFAFTSADDVLYEVNSDLRSAIDNYKPTMISIIGEVAVDTTGDNNGGEEIGGQTFTITAQSNNPAYGTVNGSGTYPEGQQATLTATPNTGYHFARWSDGNTSNPRTIFVTSDTALIAEFAINQYKVTLSANDASFGSVSGEGTYDYNTQVTLTATPATDYHFVRWSDGNTDNPRTITVTKDLTLTAEFEKDLPANHAEVLSSAGRTSCEYVQLWENGPKWATFNVGATITDYAELTIGADATPFYTDADQAPYYNTANCGGLYLWNQPNYNVRKTNRIGSVTTGVADVATTLWGSNWKTPTDLQLDTLQNSSYGKTTWTWCDGSSRQFVPGCTLKGYKVSGVGAYADKCIFLPAAGYFYWYDNTVLLASGSGHYWSSTMYDSSEAYGLHFNSSNRSVNNNNRDGYSVRAVLVEDAPEPEPEPVVVGSAEVLSSAGRSSCEWVQLWEGGPKWATFNVGATIMDYANLTVGADAIPFNDKKDLAPYYNTANVGGLYAWMQPNANARKTTWLNNVTTGISDVATTLWGSNWKTPTREQIDTLTSNKTRWVWCDGVTTQYVPGCTLIGYKVSGVGAYANNTIFIPAAGLGYAGSVGAVGTWGLYWFNTEDNGNDVFSLDFTGDYSELTSADRVYGLSVRAVLAETPQIVQYSIVLSVNDDTMGTVNGAGTYNAGARVAISATPTSGYKFVRWSDGNTENPRTIIVTEDISLTAEFAKIEYEYVDLGLPSGTLWATKNLTPENVTGPTDSFYAWGATSSSGSGTWENYRFGKSESSLTKYCVDAQYGANGFTDSKTRLEAADDAATKLWGEEWRIPTYEDWQELLACCTPVSEGYARELRSKSNGATIRFHLSGYHVNGHLEQYERQGAYWTADLYAPRCYDATAILFDGDNIMPFHALRCWGLSIRPVRKPAGKSPQAMSEDVETILSEPVVVIKRIIDGTLYIIRDGHRYTTQGLLVE